MMVSAGTWSPVAQMQPVSACARTFSSPCSPAEVKLPHLPSCWWGRCSRRRARHWSLLIPLLVVGFLATSVWIFFFPGNCWKRHVHQDDVNGTRNYKPMLRHELQVYVKSSSELATTEYLCWATSDGKHLFQVLFKCTSVFASREVALPGIYIRSDPVTDLFASWHKCHHEYALRKYSHKEESLSVMTQQHKSGPMKEELENYY